MDFFSFALTCVGLLKTLTATTAESARDLTFAQTSVLLSHCSLATSYRPWSFSSDCCEAPQMQIVLLFSSVVNKQKLQPALFSVRRDENGYYTSVNAG